MDKSWREFEKLVARIERSLAPAGAIVKTGDWIKNNLTGRKRQVDASIRYTIGTVPILITIECRKRKDKQDDTWIEQLVTKKQNLGAARTIAVVSSNISEQAKKNANFYGIEFRQMSEITQNDMLSWLKINHVEHIIYHSVLEGTSKLLMYGEPGESGGGKLHPSVIKLLATNPGNAPIFIRHSDGESLCVTNILNAAAVRMGLDRLGLHSEVPLDGTKVRKNVAINFPREVFKILTDRGPRDLARLVLSVDVHASKKVVPVPEMGFSYAGSDRPVVYGVEAQTELFGQSVTVSFHKQKGSAILHVTIAKEKVRS